MTAANGVSLPSSMRPDITKLAIGYPKTAPFCLPMEHCDLIPLRSTLSGDLNVCFLTTRVNLYQQSARWGRAAGQKRSTPIPRTRLKGYDREFLKDPHEHGFCICDDLVLLRHPSRRRLEVRAGAEQTSVPPSVGSKKRKGIFSAVLDVPRSVWRQVVTPLNNFGFGKRSLWEGGVGLFVISGAVLLSLTVAWLKGYQLRSNSQKYHAVVVFSKACGISVGTPVRIRGVDVGNVVNVRSSLDSIDVVFQVLDANVVIPQNSLVEVNQSGLLMETLIDITPRNPLPQPTVGPLDPRCSEEGLIVCDRQKIKGEQGVNLDELVGIFTRLAREVDAIGISQLYSLADRIGQSVEEAKPLLSKVEGLAGDLEPLLKEVQNGGLLKELEHLTKVLTEASLDLRKLNSSVLTPENTELLRQSVSTLTKTLKNIERISGDVSGLTGDAATKYNLKQLIESLSRLVAD